MTSGYNCGFVAGQTHMNEVWQDRIEELKSEITRIANEEEKLGTSSTDSAWVRGFRYSLHVIEEYLEKQEIPVKVNRFPAIEGAKAEMLVDGVWVKGKIVKGYAQVPKNRADTKRRYLL